MNSARIRACDGIAAMIAMRTKRDDVSIAATPERVVRAFEEMTRGYDQDPGAILATTFPNSNYDELVVVRDIAFTSLCEHHLLPFSGFAALGYIPTETVVGLSKLPRLVDCLARRLQIQERLTSEIADAIQTHLRPKAVGVILRAKHGCMTCRGVEKAEAAMITSVVRGLLRDNASLRAEFMNLICV